MSVSCWYPTMRVLPTFKSFMSTGRVKKNQRVIEARERWSTGICVEIAR